MSNEETEVKQTIATYVLEGPEAAGNTILRKAVAFWLYWRLWAFMTIFALGWFTVTLLADDHTSAGLGYMIGLVVATFASDVIYRD